MSELFEFLMIFLGDSPLISVFFILKQKKNIVYLFETHFLYVSLLKWSVGYMYSYLRQCKTIIMTIAPRNADTNETITKVRTQPNSPGASGTNKKC